MQIGLREDAIIGTVPSFPDLTTCSANSLPQGFPCWPSGSHALNVGWLPIQSVWQCLRRWITSTLLGSGSPPNLISTHRVVDQLNTVIFAGYSNLKLQECSHSRRVTRREKH